MPSEKEKWCIAKAATCLWCWFLCQVSGRCTTQNDQHRGISCLILFICRHWQKEKDKSVTSPNVTRKYIAIKSPTCEKSTGEEVCEVINRQHRAFLWWWKCAVLTIGNGYRMCEKTIYTWLHSQTLTQTSTRKTQKTRIRLMDYINVNILAMRMCFSFTKCYHWGELWVNITWLFL